MSEVEVTREDREAAIVALGWDFDRNFDSWVETGIADDSIRISAEDADDVARGFAKARMDEREACLSSPRLVLPAAESVLRRLIPVQHSVEIMDDGASISVDGCDGRIEWDSESLLDAYEAASKSIERGEHRKGT